MQLIKKKRDVDACEIAFPSIIDNTIRFATKCNLKQIFYNLKRKNSHSRYGISGERHRITNGSEGKRFSTLLACFKRTEKNVNLKKNDNFFCSAEHPDQPCHGTVTTTVVTTTRAR